jgi:hypothetical protein
MLVRLNVLHVQWTTASVGQLCECLYFAEIFSFVNLSVVVRQVPVVTG